MQDVNTCKHEHYPLFIYILFHVFYLYLVCVLKISSSGKSLLSFVYVIIFCVGACMTTLMSISDGLGPYFSCRKMGKTRSVKEEVDGEVFISGKRRHFSLRK